MLGEVRMTLITPSSLIDTIAIQAYCDTQPIQQLALFGSLLHGDSTETSDIDLLVEYDEHTPVSYLGTAQHEMDLSDIIGRRVDLRTRAELSRYFRARVIAEAMVIYERDR